MSISPVKKTIKLCPNPSNSKEVYLESILFKCSHSMDLGIYNIEGKLILNHKGLKIQTNSSRIKVPTKNLDKGIYLMKITLNNKEYIKRLVNK
ncbi:T9SS type A sorting domain-containing protein [Flavivirga aquatica]|uniref:T9SS type A sorting domain-containing protein n=1 Tax=Flavivirga aquatica TaxID=1849968 RepID=UPI0013F4F833